MTAASRELHITQALNAHRDQPGGGEQTGLSLGGSRRLLPVIELPLNVPILNARSFRISAYLDSHPKRALVESDPESAESQEVVANLVRQSHRHRDDLKESLRADGQEQVGVITRSGKLINGNSRCVLLRDLLKEGKIAPASTIRVAVLPADVGNAEQLLLENTFQRQNPFIDDYNLVGYLQMLQALADSGLSDQAIAAQERGISAKRVKELREVLVLMNRARTLPSKPLPISAFIREENQQENWLALRNKVQEIDSLHPDRQAGDDFIRQWLLSFFTDHDSVHQLRNVTEEWVQRDVLPHLVDAGKDGELIHDHATAVAPESSEDAITEVAPAGLDLLGGEDEVDSPKTAAAQTLLDLAVQSAQDPDQEITLPDGSTRTGQEIQKVLKAAVREGLDESAQRRKNSNRLTRPQTEADNAAQSLKRLLEAIEDVAEDADFTPRLGDLRTSLDTIQSRLEEANDLLSAIPAMEADEEPTE
ncbi:hypothetical protein [Microbacterium sp.]|uniref:hypothetical protein n=1 Tax=Microbacterium sp. TaxID=51671 RepID=UPI003C73F9C9